MEVKQKEFAKASLNMKQQFLKMWIDVLPDPHVNFVSPEYFKTMEIPLLAGRDFRPTDLSGAPKVYIVNAAFAKRYFATTNARGHRIGMGFDPGTKTDITIVGVA